MWAFGSPIRMLEITLAGIAGLLLRDKSPKLQIAVFTTIILFSVLSFIAGTFNLERKSVLASLQYAGELNPLKSPEYLFATIALIIVILLAAWRISKGSNFTKTSHLFIGVAVILGLVSADEMASKNMRGHYNRTISSQRDPSADLDKT